MRAKIDRWSRPTSTRQNVYIITTDQGQYRVCREWLDYKTTIANMKKAGYTNIVINYIGHRI